MLKDGIGFSQVIVCCGRVDLSKGIPVLTSYFRLNYGLGTTEKGTLFLFCGNRSDRIKGIVFEGLPEDFCYPHIFHILHVNVDPKDKSFLNDLMPCSETYRDYEEAEKRKSMTFFGTSVPRNVPGLHRRKSPVPENQK